MKAFYTDQFVLPLPPTHRFPMAKYARLRERLVREGVFRADELLVPPAATDEQILRVHAPEYLARVVAGEMPREELKRLGFPWSPELVERSRRSSGATIQAALAALREGCGVNLAGGTHHAFYDRAEGYCLFNDTVIAASELHERGAIRRVLVVDADVHQGNGTAALARDRDWLFTFSIHSARNYPFAKEQSDLDIELPDGTTDEVYLQRLAEGVDQGWRAIDPELVIYLAGADPFEGDRMGRLALTKGGLLERDRLVLERCQRFGTPVAISMAGGYAENIDDIVDIHFATISLARALFGA